MVSPDAPLSLLAGSSVLIWPHSMEGQPLVMSVARPPAHDWRHGEVRVTQARLGSTRRPQTQRLPGKTRLNDSCHKSLGRGIAHVLVVPRPVWAAGVRRPTSTWIPREDDPTIGYQEHELTARVVAFTQPHTPALRGSAPAAAQARIDGITEELGALTSDVVYRIENSALFDDTVPLTREFSLLLMRWEDELAHATPSALERLAMELRLAFDTARQHAEAVGLNHLPRTARAKAERAVKAAQLAVDAATDGEREAASTQLARLLDGIALHYLPGSAEARRMIGDSLPQLREAP